MTSNEPELMRQAIEARENAIAPFSKFKVGAALRTRGGTIYRGCNVENATFGLTVCAERVALLTALAAGEREFEAIAVASQSPDPASPCGACRQLLWEYCGNISVTLTNLDGKSRNLNLGSLFPEPFTFSPEE